MTNVVNDKYKTLTAVSITAEATVWTPATDHKFVLRGFDIVCSATGNVTLKDNTAGATIFVIPVTANVPVPLDLGPGIMAALKNNLLTATHSTASTITGTLWGTEVYAP